jgi:hypothetical protein
VKVLQGRIGDTQEHTGIGNNYLKELLIAQQLRERIEKWDRIKLKTSA